MVRLADDFVRIIIRRPHAYFFLKDLFGSSQGFTDGSTPLPGVYVLDPKGKFQTSVGIAVEDAKDRLIEALGGS